MALTREERRTLLDIARSAIEAGLAGGAPARPEPATAALARTNGAFVTLHKMGALRGCIGRFIGDGPLSSTVAEMATSAAFGDPRFAPLTRDELACVDIEISVLTPLERTLDPTSIEVGRHGIYIIKGARRGVLLPQVATECGFDRETFLEQTCMKAGLPRSAWRDAGTEIYTFEAEIFGEKERGAQA